MNHRKFSLKLGATVTLIALLILAFPAQTVLADNTPTRYPSTWARIGLVTNPDWTNMNKTVLNDDVYSETSLTAGATSKILQATGFNFTDTPIIPVGSKIDGIQVDIALKASGIKTRETLVSLIKNNVVQPANKKKTTELPTKETLLTYGSPTDTWEDNTWTVEDINNANFGIAYAVTNENASGAGSLRYVDIDYIQMTVYYTPPAPITTSMTVNCGNGNPTVSFGSSIPCTVTVERSGGAETPTGSVSWTSDSSGSFSPESCPLSGAGLSASCSTPVLYTPGAVGDESHLITATFEGSSVSQTLRVEKANPVVTLSLEVSSITYTGSPQSAKPVISNEPSVPGIVDPASILYKNSAEVPTNAGSYPVTASFIPDDTANYNTLTSIPAGTFTIGPKPATVTPNPASKIYGSGDPSLDGTLEGFIPSDNVTATYKRAAGETVAGGPYVISAVLSPADILTNYEITYQTAEFTIQKKDASVTPHAASKIYSAADPDLNGSLTGFLPADGVTATYSRAKGETVVGGTYAISAVLSPAEVLSNYNITYGTASFLIQPKAASVTPDATSKTYGEADPSLNGSLAGFLPGDSVTATYNRTAGENASEIPYLISAKLSPAGVLSNYDITYNTAEFIIHKANPVLSVTHSSVVFDGEFHAAAIVSSVSGEVTGIWYNGEATLPRSEGIYTITVDFTSTDPNYNSLNKALAGTFEIRLGNPALTLEVTASKATYAVTGEVIEFTFVLTNSGDATLVGPFIVDHDPIDAICLVTTSLAPSAQLTCTGTYTIQAEDITAETVEHIVNAQASYNGEPVTSSTASVTLIYSPHRIYMPSVLFSPE